MDYDVSSPLCHHESRLWLEAVRIHQQAWDDAGKQSIEGCQLLPERFPTPSELAGKQLMPVVLLGVCKCKR